MKKGNFYRNLFEEVQKSSILNYSLIKRIIPRNELFIYKFLHERDLSTEQQKKFHPLSRKSLLLFTKCQLPFEMFHILPTINRISHASSNEFHPIRDNPFARSRKREGGRQRAERRGREGEGKSCAAARRSNGGGRREALREGKGSFNESATSKCHATPLFVT